MPEHARVALVQQLQRSGLLDRYGRDAESLFGKRLSFHAQGERVSARALQRVLSVAAVEIGCLSLTGPFRRGCRDAYGRWLEMVARAIAEELTCMPASSAKAMPAAIALATHLIQQRYDGSLSLGQLASEVGLSRERLSRLFHTVLGITFSNYLNKVRLDEARRRLALEDATMAEIAAASGFQSLSQFNRRFKAVEGMSPGDYRKRVRGCGFDT